MNEMLFLSVALLQYTLLLKTEVFHEHTEKKSLFSIIDEVFWIWLQEEDILYIYMCLYSKI